MLFNTQLRKKPQHFTMKLGLAWVGAMEIEIIQPVEGDSIYREYLNQHGDGLHHISTSVTSFARAVEHMEQEGLPVLQSGMLNAPLLIGGVTLPPLPDVIAKPFGPRFAFFDTEQVLGTVIEYSAMPPGMPYRVAVRIGKADQWMPMDATNISAPLSNRFISAVHKIGVIVRDAEAVSRRYAQHLGIEGWKTETLEFADARLRGQPISCRVRLATADVGGVKLELAQPLEGASAYHEWLDQQGEGIHYIGVSAAGMSTEQTLARFAAEGCDVLMDSKNSSRQRRIMLNSKLLTGAVMELTVES
jgi:catechol 2,3-dioxygenase-like lactoylglutathione lyase family enzyme